MQPTRPFVHDRWAGLAHIPALTTRDGIDRLPGTPPWMDDVDARRLTAYRVLAAYRDNARRFWLPQAMWEGATVTLPGGSVQQEGTAPAEKFREYGHAGLVVDTARAILLGDDQTVVLPALAEAEAAAAELEAASGDDGQQAPGAAQGDPDDETRAAAAGLERLRTADDWLQEWAAKERLPIQLLAAEHHAVGDGDAVLVLGWSDARRRPRLRVYDPGFYFPDLTTLETVPGWEDDYPPVVHLAWEREDPDGTRWLRRTTWQMVRLDQPATAPWGRPREWTCWHSVTEWDLSKLKPRPGEPRLSIYTLRSDDPAASVVEEARDTGLDFIPVIHVPNDDAGDEHWGTSILIRIAQVLDDLSGSDTDLAVTSETSAAPALHLSGMGPQPAVAGGPGGVLWGPEGSGAGYVDSSKVLTAGLQWNEKLLNDLAINVRLAVALLGRVVPSEVPSGYALQLGFAPARSLLREMRLVRAEKYALLLKMALRMAQAAGELDQGETPEALLDFGSGLPSDRAAAIEEVTALLKQHAISTSTAIRMLMAAGLPIEDADAELDAIRQESWDAAVQLVEATGDVAAAKRMLGLEVEDPNDTPGDSNNEAQALNNGDLGGTQVQPVAGEPAPTGDPQDPA